MLSRETQKADGSEFCEKGGKAVVNFKKREDVSNEGRCAR